MNIKEGIVINWKKIRLTIQILVFILFLFLLIQTEYRGSNELQYPVRIFLDFDPLILFSTVLSVHGIPEGLPGAMILALLLVALTMILGRFFCGWICPFGALNNFFSWLKRRRAKKKKSYDITTDYYTKTQRWKYFLLGSLLVSSFFSLQLSGIFDPLSLIIRSFAVAVNPIINLMLRSFFDAVYFLRFKPFTAVTEPVYSFLKDNYLSFYQPSFSYAALIAIIFFSIVALNFYRFRFWCRYLCPLGALLGFIGRRSLLQLKVNSKCTGCNACIKECPAAAEPQAKKGGKEHGWRPSECFFCWNCVDTCPVDALSFKFTKPVAREKTVGIDVGRRGFITACAVGLLAAPTLRTGVSYKYPNPDLIRPPGSLNEPEFLKRCIRCGECMKVCLTNVIQPSLFEAGFEGTFTPMLDMKAGYCEYNCTLCGQVCPTGAIKELTIEAKEKTKIGLAFFDKNRCIPYKLGINCMVCEEHCPTPNKAIWFEEKEVLNYRGEIATVKLPRVNIDDCIGCGICQNKCPVMDSPAIYVTSIGETRNPDNQMLLETASGEGYY